jgi:GPH family glycoside/pentoside/hexuronide:cation symporter
MTQAGVARWRLLIYAGGDFAFNLYWQSMMLYLLFYYTEAVRLPMAQGAACYAIAMAWDGIASLAVGLWADRHLPAARYRVMIGLGALPLGLSFAMAYAPPPLHGPGVFAWVLGGHLVFRTVYSLVNIPYLALSARLGTTEADRARLAGWRMLAGTLAAVIVAVGTLPLGHWLTGSHGPAAYAAAAWAFAGVGSVVLVACAAVVPPLTRRDVPMAQSAWRVLGGAWSNRAFVNLAAAMLAMIVASTMIDKAVLYYFKYVLHDQQAGELTLGWMMATGALAVPCWMALGRWLGVAAGWFVAIGLCTAALALFISGAVVGVLALSAFLVVVQAALVGLGFTLWALLPGVIEAGERAARVSMGAVVYGLFALIQRVGIGLGTLLLGLQIGQLGSDPGAGAALRLAIAAMPLGFLLVSAGIMLANPLVRRRG